MCGHFDDMPAMGQFGLVVCAFLVAMIVVATAMLILR
jgi:hypothetical protein